MSANQSSPASFEPESDGGHFGIGFLVGTLLGAAGVYLLGTDSGRETMQQLRLELEKLSHPDETGPSTDPQPTEPSRDLKDLPPVEKPEVFIAQQTSTVKENPTFPKFKKKS